jgi:hypothetical protein
VFFAFSLFGKFLLLFFRSRHAAICCLQATASSLIAMAQMKPNSIYRLEAWGNIWTLMTADDGALAQSTAQLI